jgi:uncharacterized membrane protein
MNPAKTSSENQNIEAVNSYLMFFISGLLTLQTVKTNKFVRFHAYQSIYFSLAFLVFIGLINYVPLVGSYLVRLCLTIFFFTWFYLILTAYQNKEIKLPYLGDIAEKEANKK